MRSIFEENWRYRTLSKLETLFHVTNVTTVLNASVTADRVSRLLPFVAVAVCGSAAQCVAVRCSVLQWRLEFFMFTLEMAFKTWIYFLEKWRLTRFRCVALCCSVLHCAAVCCIVLQCVAVCCSVLQIICTTTENPDMKNTPLICILHP